MNFHHLSKMAGLTPDILFRNIDQLSAWQDVLGIFIIPYQQFCNPLRTDTQPTCWLYYHNGKIRLSDFGSKHGIKDFHNWDLINAYRDKYRFGFQECMVYLAENYASNIDVNLTFNIHLPQSAYRSNKNKIPFLISYRQRDWTSIDSSIWKPYDLDKKMEDEVIPLDAFWTSKDGGNTWRSNKCSTSYPDYAVPSIVSNHTEVYRITKPKRFRHLSNWVETDIGGKCPANSNVLWVTTGVKDYGCVINTGRDSKYIQCETIHLGKPLLDTLVKDYDYVFFLTDNDPTGIESAQRFEQEAKLQTGKDMFRGVTLPRYGDDSPKDPGEYVRRFSTWELNSELKALEV